MGGARPLSLSCAVVIEEGLPVETLRVRLRAALEFVNDALAVYRGNHYNGVLDSIELQCRAALKGE